MTGATGQCGCDQHYLLDPRTSASTLRENVLGPKRPLFALVATLAAHRHIETLAMLYSGASALHAALNDTAGFRQHQAFADQFGAPFVRGDRAPSHAVRAVAGLGLVLAQEQPEELPLRAALAWYQEARSSLGGSSCSWSPARLAADDPVLRRRLDLLAEVAAARRDAWAALTVAVTMRCLAHPAGPDSASRRGRVLRSPEPAIGLLFDRGGAGQQATLTAVRLGGTPSGLVPDPEQMALFTADESFQSALGRAWSQAGQGKIDGMVLWSAGNREGPCSYITGESAGAAFAVVLDETRRLERRLAPLTVLRRLAGNTAITGKIDDAGYLQPVEGYANKLAAVRELAKVIVPASDVGKAAKAAAKELEIVPAVRWKDAAHTARKRSRIVILRQFLAAAVVVALVAGGLAWRQRTTADTQRQVNLSEAFATQSDSTVGVNLRQADLYALAAWQARHTEQARSSLLSREADPYLGSFAEPAQFAVTTLAISPDGRLLAVGGTPDPQHVRISSVQLWDIATRRQLAAFATPGAVRTVAFSPDGATLAATPATSSVGLRLWSVATHRELPDPVTEKGVTSIAYSPDGRLLAVGALIPPYSRPGRPLVLASVPAVIDLWDLITHRMVRRLSGFSGPVWSLDFSDDGQMLASGGYDHTARVWDTATWQERRMLTGTGAAVQAVRFDPGSHDILAVGGPDGAIRIWDATTGTVYPTVPNSGAATAFAFSPGERYLYASLDSHDVFRVDLYTGNVTGDPLRLQVPVTQMAFSPDGRTLVVGGSEGSLAALDTGGRTFYEQKRSPLTAAAVNRSGQLAATGAADGTVQLWAVRDPAAGVTLSAGQDVVSAAAFSPADGRLAAGTAGCRVSVWDFRNARHIVDLSNARRIADLAAPGTSGGTRLLHLAFSRDGNTLATYCANNASPGSAVATLWDTRTFRRLAVYSPPGALFAGGMAYSPDGHTLALDTGGGRVVFWDTRLRRVTGQISAGPGTHYALAFSPDGRLLAITAADDTVELWNVSSRAEVAVTSPPNTSMFHYLAFAPDGSTLAGTSQDSTVRIWQVPSLQLIETLSPPTPPLATGVDPAAYNGVAYSPDGGTLVTAGSDGTAQVWDLNPGDAVRNLCNAVSGPQLTSQWQQLAPSPGPDPCPAR